MTTTPEEEPTEPTPCMNVRLEFGDKTYGTALFHDDLTRFGVTEFARQAAEMVERTIVSHYGAMPMMPEVAE